MAAPPRILVAVRLSPSSNTPEATPTRFIRYWYTKARLAPTPEMLLCHAQNPKAATNTVEYANATHDPAPTSPQSVPQSPGTATGMVASPAKSIVREATTRGGYLLSSGKESTAKEPQHTVATTTSK